MKHMALTLATIFVLVAACGGSVATPSAGPSVVYQPPPTTAPVTPIAPPSGSPSTPPDSTTPAVLPGESWIAFNTSGAEGVGVYLVREDGTGMHRWPADIVGGGEQPDWSPDGQWLAVNSRELDDTDDIWMAGADGTGLVRLVDCVAPCVWTDEPAWSPDGTRIAFQRLEMEDDVIRSTLEVVDVDTGTATVLVTMPEPQAVLASRWSPDGGQLVVEVITLSRPTLDGDVVGGGIGIVDLAAAAPAVEMLVPSETFARSPDWSSDGGEIIYAQPSAGDPDLSDLRGIAPDGTGARQITDLAASGASASRPTFAPEGDRIVFVHARPGMQETVAALIDLDGSDLRPATPNGFQDGNYPRLRPR